MDQSYRWVSRIPDDKYVLRRVIGARSLVNPMTGRHLYSWRRLGPALGEGSSMTFLARLKEAGVLGVPVSRDQVRLVTHRDASRGQIDQAIEKIRGLVRVAA